jgi:ribosomal-protein-alanine N-acetyltransferase
MSAPRIRPAEINDQPILSALLNREYYTHRHLDWRPPLDWLGHRPFWLAEERGVALAALAFPADPPGVAWVRLFAASGQMLPGAAWRALFEPALAQLAGARQTMIAAVGLNAWFTDLLKQNHFEHYQDIVVLAWNNQLPNPRSMPARLTVRPMQMADLPEVAEVDNLAFEPLWRNSIEDIRLAFHMCAFASVVEKDGRILGFQMSTSTPLATHLARLAVRPDVQRQNIGYVLVYNLFSQYRRAGSWQLTVNTQHTNHASLALYQSMGFDLTGDKFPVFLYQHGDPSTPGS